ELSKWQWAGVVGDMPNATSQSTEVAPPAESTNLALGQVASQSDGNSAAAALAVDGNMSGNGADGSLATQDARDAPWWQVDLGEQQPISEVHIWGRTDDCCA